LEDLALLAVPSWGIGIVFDWFHDGASRTFHFCALRFGGSSSGGHVTILASDFDPM
jgi:hypothetical protein